MEDTQLIESSNDSFAASIERHELDQQSGAEFAGKKAALPQHAKETPAPKTDLLDAIENEKSVFADNQSEFDELREKRAKEAAEKAAEKEAAEPTLPESLAKFDPEKVQAAMDKYALEAKDLADPRWADLVATELGQADAEQDQTQQQPANPQEAFTAHVEGIRKIAADPSINSPEMVAAFRGTLAECFGASPDQPEAMQNVDRLSDALMVGGLNLMTTVVPKIVQSQIAQYLEHAYPGIGDDYVERSCEKVWDGIRGEDFGGSLPKYGTPQFETEYQSAMQKNTWLNKVGQGLPWNEAIKVRAAALGRVMAGEKFSPQAIKDAIVIGEKKASGNTRKVTAGKSLGAGRSSGGFAGPTSDTAFRDAILAHNAAQRSSERRG